MPTVVKFGKLYMKDSSGNIVQIIPESNALVANYTGATSSSAGAAGLVPAAGIAERNSYLKGDGTWGTISIPQTPTYVGASAVSNGSAGLVPAATSAQKDNFLKGDGTWGAVATEKEVSVLTSEPTSSNTDSLDNDSIIVWKLEPTGDPLEGARPVLTAGNQTISGVKTFTSGIFSGKKVMESNESAFDCTAATCFTKTITANTTFSFINVPEDAVCCITVILINGGSKTITWPSGVKWPLNTPPELSASGTDVLTFITATGGNVWYATTTCLGVTA